MCKLIFQPPLLAWSMLIRGMGTWFGQRQVWDIGTGISRGIMSQQHPTTWYVALSIKLLDLHRIDVHLIFMGKDWFQQGMVMDGSLVHPNFGTKKWGNPSSWGFQSHETIILSGRMGDTILDAWTPKNYRNPLKIRVAVLHRWQVRSPVKLNWLHHLLWKVVFFFAGRSKLQETVETNRLMVILVMIDILSWLSSP